MLQYSTYLINCTICLSMAMVLLLIKGISTVSPKNEAYRRSKNLMVVSLLIEAMGDIVTFVFMRNGADPLILNRMFVPLLYFIQMSIMIVVALNMLHSIKFTIHHSLLIVAPLLVLMAVHVGVFVWRYGLSFTSPCYLDYLSTTFSVVISRILNAGIIVEALLCIYLIIVKTRRFFRNIDNYVSGPSVEQSHWLLYINVSFLLFFIAGALDFMLSSYWSDIIIVWIKSAVFIVACTGAINVQSIYLDISPAFSKKAEAMMRATEASGNVPPSESDSKTIDAIVARWTERSDKPYLHESITVVQVADEMGLSPRLLSQYINNVKHVNFNTWINQLKVAEVKRIIDEDPESSFLHIANRTGFTDASAMSKVFKNVTGMSPSVYRRRN